MTNQTFTQEALDLAIQSFTDAWKQNLVTYYNDFFKSVHSAELIASYTNMRIKTGRKYIKVYTGTSISAFIDKNTGDIYRPAGLNAPAKGIRGNVMSATRGTEAFATTALPLSHSSLCIRYMG